MSKQDLNKDIRAIKERVERLEQWMKKQSCQRKRQSITAFLEEDDNENRKTLRRWIGNKTLKQCIWESMEITVYSDGSIRDYNRLKDKSSVIDSEFTVMRTLFDKAGKVITAWEWSYELDGETDTYMHKEHDSAIAARFDDIEKLSSSYNCWYMF